MTGHDPEHYHERYYERDTRNTIVYSYQNSAAYHKEVTENELRTAEKALKDTDYESALSALACAKSHAEQVNDHTLPAEKYQRLMKAAHKIGAEKNLEKVERAFGEKSNIFFRLLRPVLSRTGYYEHALDMAEHHYNEAGIHVPGNVAALRHKIK